MGEADERRRAADLRRDLAQRPLGGPDESRPQEEVLRRIAGDRELGKEDEVGLRVARLREPREDPVAVALEVADDRVDLSQGEPHPTARIPVRRA